MDWLTTDRLPKRATEGLWNLYQEPRHQRSEPGSLIQVPLPHIMNVLVCDFKPLGSPPKPHISRFPTPAIWSASRYNVATAKMGQNIFFRIFEGVARNVFVIFSFVGKMPQGC